MSETRSFLITGANKGIGLALTKRILKEIDNSFVFLGSRNKQRGLTAIEAVIEENEKAKGRVKVVEIDVSKENSINLAKNEVEKFLEENVDNQPLEGIVNNAGVFGQNTMATILNINVSGSYKVTKAFEPLLKKNGRVVNVSSSLGPSFVAGLNETWKKFFFNTDVKWSDISELMNIIIEEYDSDKRTNDKLTEMGVAEANVQAAYGLSKGLLNSLTMMQAKDYPTLKVNSTCPGFIFTDMTSHYVKGDEAAAKKMGMTDVESGTISPFYLLTSDKVNTGDYYNADATKGALSKLIIF